jgi:sulfate adenylyltransferase
MTSPPARASLDDVSALPHILPAAAELDDLELALAGAVPVAGVAVEPASPAAQHVVGDALVLTDLEGTPLARLDLDVVQPDEDGAVVRLRGPVTALQPPEHGPFRRLRRTVDEVAELVAGRHVVAVPIDQPLQDAHLGVIHALPTDDVLLLMPLIGTRSPRLLSPSALVRMALAAAEALPNALVVPVPLARRAEPADDLRLRERVAQAYGAVDVLHLDNVAEAIAVEDLEIALELGDPIAGIGPGVEAELRRGYRRADQRGLTVFFTGLSGSGKSTVARALAEAVDEEFGRPVTLLDGDVVRTMLSAGLTFSKADRELNIRRIGYVAAEIGRHGGLAVCCPIAPYAATRAEVRAMVTGAGADFVLVHISTPVAECERRDRKGLYAKARAGLIPDFTGISAPYEEPVDADLAIDTTDVPVSEAVERVLALLVARGALGRDQPASEPADE